MQFLECPILINTISYPCLRVVDDSANEKEAHSVMTGDQQSERRNLTSWIFSSFTPYLGMKSAFRHTTTLRISVHVFIGFSFNLAPGHLEYRCQPSRIPRKISWPPFGGMDTSSFRGFWRVRRGWFIKRNITVVLGRFVALSLGKNIEKQGGGWIESNRRLK